MPQLHNSTVAKVIYGGFFVAVLPFLLVLWANAASTVVTMPVAPFPSVGFILAAVGLAVMVLAMWELIHYGNGLPLNIAPPQKYVSSGLYALLPHPIYVGFTTCCFGVSWAFQSSAGLWLVSPCVALGCFALVWGYERIDLTMRFGEARRLPFIRLPSWSSAKPDAADSISVLILQFAAWIFFYYIFVVLGISPRAMNTVSGMERGIAVLEWTVICYTSVYLFVAVAPFLAQKKEDLRLFVVSGWWGSVVVFLIYCCFPLYAEPRPYDSSSIFAPWIALERSTDSPAAAFPSFHVFWAFLAARLYSIRFPAMKWWLYGIAIIISVSCFTTGVHSIADILAGYAVFLLVRNPIRLHHTLIHSAEAFANSWREWRLGSFRIIIHGIYAGLAGFAGVLIVDSVTDSLPAVIIAVSTLIGAALWAQGLESSSGLLRPFGYFGAIIGGTIGVGSCTLIGYDFWQLLAACALASPAVQAVGRLRCLVQGCCHGQKCSANNGIVYSSPQSRVVRAGLGGRAIYPTPLYSIAVNLALGCVLVRLWIESAPYSSIAGVYFLGTGFSRFIEEAYRGEPQTLKTGGLRVYQWLAAGFVIVGAILTTVPTGRCSSFSWNFSTVAVALCAGIIFFVAMGVDMPLSNKRFSRLTL